MNARELRLLFVVAGAVVFVDTMFYAAVVPLLPALTRELHLSKASAGVLTAGYAAGTLVGSIPGGMLAARPGPRATIYAGLFLMGSRALPSGCSTTSRCSTPRVSSRASAAPAHGPAAWPG